MDYVTGGIGEIKLKIRSELDRKPYFIFVKLYIINPPRKEEDSK